MASSASHLAPLPLRLLGAVVVDESMDSPPSLILLDIRRRGWFQPRPFFYVVKIHLNLVVSCMHRRENGHACFRDSPVVAISWGGQLHVTGCARDGVRILHLNAVQRVMELHAYAPTVRYMARHVLVLIRCACVRAHSRHEVT